MSQQYRLKSCFQVLAEQQRTALIPFITAGDPLADASVDIMHALVDAGADVIELGIPFSDPMADGPVIQLASERAIERGVSLRTVLQDVHNFRQNNQKTPVILMGYLNPLYRMGFAQFAESAAAAGVDGVLIVDSPPEESVVLESLLAAVGISMIRLVAPTTTAERMRLIAAEATGFIYYVALKGITGAGSGANSDAESGQRIKTMRELTGLPVAAGFGIKDAESAADWAQLADAVVIGSALVTRLAECESSGQACEAVKSFLAPIRIAMDNVTQ
ncbi:MAG: tryptophan synthase subunit alpha [Xanthomonadales bacterium]|nr:tryptophan synthase subunit alpha [Xanthomonadales bacterium]